MLARFKKGSVTRQISLAVFLLFLIVILVGTFQTNRQTKDLALELVEEKLIAINDSYFNALHMLILSKEIQNRPLLREQFMMQNSNILDLRLLRSNAVKQQFGRGLVSGKITDDIDTPLLAGERTVQINDGEQGRVLTLATPYLMSNDRAGIDCLSCHDNSSGSIAGGIRISYNLSDLDREIQNNQQQSLVLNFVIFLLGFLLLVIYLQRNLTRGLKEVDLVVEAITAGDTDIHIPDIRHDNIGRLMLSLRKMLEQIKLRQQQMQEDSDELQGQVSLQLEQQAQGMAASKFYEESTVELLETVQGAADHVHDYSGTLMQTATELNTKAYAVVNEGDHALEEISQMTEAAEQLNTMFSRLSQSGHESTRISELVKKNFDNTSHRVRSLADASQNIDSIISFIGKIAQQTSMLALNANIEAARAGPAGRGFSIVASEVKSLAEQTTAFTEQISDQITAIQNEGCAASLAIEEISTAIDEMDVHTHEFKSTIDKQSSVSEIISTVVQQTQHRMLSMQQAASDVINISESTTELVSKMEQESHGLINKTAEQKQAMNQFSTVLARMRNEESGSEDDEIFF